MKKKKSKWMNGFVVSNLQPAYKHIEYLLNEKRNMGQKKRTQAIKPVDNISSIRRGRLKDMRGYGA